MSQIRESNNQRRTTETFSYDAYDNRNRLLSETRYLHKDLSTTELEEMSGGDIVGLHEAIAYTIEWRIMQYISDDYLSEKFKSHVNKEYAWAFLYYKLGPTYDK